MTDSNWPTWLVERAARDDPPTTLGDSLLARFVRVGVTDFPPADGSMFLDPTDAGRATAVGATGPGIPFAESFEDEPAPVAGALTRLVAFVERFDKLRRLRLAAIDMEFAATTARALADETGPARMFARVLETGLIVTYVRPFLPSNRGGGLGKRWHPRPPDDVEIHDKIVALRNPYHAHADRTRQRTLIDTTAFLGLDGPPIFAEAWDELRESDLLRLAALADRLAERFAVAADAVGVELGEQRTRPSYPRSGPRVNYRFEGGIEAASRELQERLRDQLPGRNAEPNETMPTVQLEPPLTYDQTLDLLSSWEGRTVAVTSHSQVGGEPMSHSQTALYGELGPLHMVDNRIDPDIDSVAAYRVGPDGRNAIYLGVADFIHAVKLPGREHVNMKFRHDFHIEVQTVG